MSKIVWIALVAASACLVNSSPAGIFAESVQQYEEGSGVAAGYNNPANVLGAPSLVNPPAWGEPESPITPFNPPWMGEQMVSIGTGGSLVLHMGTAIPNAAANPFGIDFIVFGGAGFYLTNYFDPIQRTDGTLFNPNEGTARISVSQDGATFYPLDPARAPLPDDMFPTDASGNFQMPVNPALTAGSFEGLALAEIRALYGGSGGGTGYDLAWALDANGQPVNLEYANYVRIDMLDGKADIDAVVAVPEPATWVILALGASLVVMACRRK